MNPKISFGVDYLHAMDEANMRSAGDDYDWTAYKLARIMLCWDWNFSSEEEDEANEIYNEKIKTETREEFPIVAHRLIDHLKSNEEAKRKFLTNMIMINYMDSNITEDEKKLTFNFANDLDFRKSEIAEMAKRAKDLTLVIKWFADDYNM